MLQGCYAACTEQAIVPAWLAAAVRDLLLNLKPKDFDIVTDARPEQVKKLSAGCC